MEPLSVVLTSFYPDDTAAKHHTQEFELWKKGEETPILRRGSQFYMTVRFNRSFNSDKDVIRFRFELGPEPAVTKGTKIVFTLPSNEKQLSEDATQWGLVLSRYVEEVNDFVLDVRVSSLAPVGAWRFSIQTNIKHKKEPRNTFRYKEKVYVLFNPWSKSDPVYMENEEDLKEYIQNEIGKIWVGTYKNPKSRPWFYGQFHEYTLPAAIALLEKSGLQHLNWGSPVLVSRALSAVINANDDNGLLELYQKGKQNGGRSPFSWTGSIAILEEYLRSEKPVKYGQCWVFSAVTVTLSRALGIPSRSVTNYVSAMSSPLSYNNNQQPTINRFFDIHGDRIDDPRGPEHNDRLWEFHVWDEVWMDRSDLPSGYGGWQVIDSTPRFVSDGIFRCGPASVEAVKKEHLGISYDTRFIYAAVNATISHYQEDPDSEWGFVPLSVDKYSVGRRIVTKRPGKLDDLGDTDLLDITSQYKSPEKQKNGPQIKPEPINFRPQRDVPKDVFFDLTNKDFVPLGETFEVTLDIRNRSNEERNIDAKISVLSVYYDGKTASNIKRIQQTFTVGPRRSETVQLAVTPTEYVNKLVEYNLIKVFASAVVEETKQTWSEEDDFIITKPRLHLLLKESAPKLGQKSVIGLSFKNPLDVPLTNGEITVEGPKILSPKPHAVRVIEPKETVTFEEVVTPIGLGYQLLVANFSSNELQGIEENTYIHVR